jgi:hypothetical protein
MLSIIAKKANIRVVMAIKHNQNVFGRMSPFFSESGLKCEKSCVCLL